jgi:hypothetical protein
MTDFAHAHKAFLTSLQSGQHEFATTLTFIEHWYEFTPTAFDNGPVHNTEKQNQGSCKVLALAELLQLSDEQTLLCFGEHYRDVLDTPDVDNHHNLRRLLRDGRSDVHFDQFPLQAKQEAL